MRRWRSKKENRLKSNERFRRWRTDNLKKARASSLAWYYAHHDEQKKKALAYQLATRTTSRGRFRVLKAVAKSRGLGFNIQFETYCELIRRPCHYCGISISDMSGHGLDRANNKIGYITDNVVPCCFSCNRIKSNLLTCDEMKAAMEAVKKVRLSKMLGEPEQSAIEVA